MKAGRKGGSVKVTFNKKMKQAREVVIRVSGKAASLGKILASVK